MTGLGRAGLKMAIMLFVVISLLGTPVGRVSADNGHFVDGDGVIGGIWSWEPSEPGAVPMDHYRVQFSLTGIEESGWIDWQDVPPTLNADGQVVFEYTSVPLDARTVRALEKGYCWAYHMRVRAESADATMVSPWSDTSSLTLFPPRGPSGVDHQ